MEVAKMLYIYYQGKYISTKDEKTRNKICMSNRLAKKIMFSIYTRLAFLI